MSGKKDLPPAVQGKKDHIAVKSDVLLEKPESWPDEVGGPQGPEPTRYGDWQFKGRVSDF